TVDNQSVRRGHVPDFLDAGGIRTYEGRSAATIARKLEDLHAAKNRRHSATTQRGSKRVGTKTAIDVICCLERHAGAIQRCPEQIVAVSRAELLRRSRREVVVTRGEREGIAWHWRDHILRLARTHFELAVHHEVSVGFFGSINA